MGGILVQRRARHGQSHCRYRGPFGSSCRRRYSLVLRLHYRCNSFGNGGHCPSTTQRPLSIRTRQIRNIRYDAHCCRLDYRRYRHIHRRNKTCYPCPARRSTCTPGMDSTHYMLRLNSNQGVAVSLHATRGSKDSVGSRHCKCLASQV